MMVIKDVSIEDFVGLSKQKRIIAVGAGRKFKAFIERHGLIDGLHVVIDGDREKIGTTVDFGCKQVLISGYDYFATAKNMEDAVVLVTAYIPLTSILAKLDEVEELDGVGCYIAPLMEEKFEDAPVSYTRGKAIIPKVIHYFWFGDEMPLNLQSYVASWKKIMPDYEIIRWDESNYDVRKNKYMNEAYTCRKFGYVPDYARLDVLHQYGGIYLDTDVEVIKRFDDLLYDNSFMGFFDCNVVNLGVGFGCVKGNDLVGNLKESYDKISFFGKDGKMNLTTCVEYQYPLLEKYGFVMNNTQQNINGNVLYPVQVFNPEAKLGVHLHYTNNTHSIHHSQVSYEDSVTRKQFLNRTKYLTDRVEGTL